MNRIRELREARSVSGVDLARLLNISPQYLYSFEKETRTLSTDMAAKLADYFSVSIDYLLGRAEISAAGPTQEDEISANLDPDIQFIMRARQDLTPKAYERFIRLAKEMKKSFEEDDDD